LTKGDSTAADSGWKADSNHGTERGAGSGSWKRCEKPVCWSFYCTG